ncbi:MAG: hypothetical protein M3461_13105 [Pseudomonadota bacterium]|nr:hypothetical protein [Pseudomonadota bacterium]
MATLLAFWTDQKTQADAALPAALTALTSAQNDLVTQRANLAKANQELADLVKQTAQIRTDLAEAVTPADVDALEPKLATAIRDTRVKQAEIIGIEGAIDTAQTTLDLATATVASATARVYAVAAALEAADQQDKDRVQVAAGQAVRASNSVTISGLTGHPFIVNDVITVMGMTDTSFNGTFTISAVTDTSITYPQTQVAVGSGQAVRASNSVTISGLTDHPFIVNDVITVIGMTDTSFDGTFTISAVTDNTVTYPQTQADATSGDGVIQAADATSGDGVIQPDATSGGGVIFGKRALRLRHKLATPPLSTMVADATAALAANPWTDANARIEADIPLELLACARERANVELKRLENDNKKVAETANLLGNEQQLFDNADAAFRDYVVNAKGRFDQALAIAARVADPKQNPLTEAQKLSINNAALEKEPVLDAGDAAVARQVVATAQIDVDAKQTDLDVARLKALARDIDKDPETDPVDLAVIAAIAALDTANTTLDNAKTAFTADMQTLLTDWETAVPDTAWRNLADFEEATRLLIGLRTDPAPLVTAMDDAEAALVAALSTAEKAGRTLSLLESEALKAASKARFDTGSLPRRALSALRGDS